MKTKLNKKQEIEINEYVLGIFKVVCAANKIDWILLPKQYRDIAITMFIEGFKYCYHESKEKQK